MSNPADYCEIPYTGNKPKGLYTIVLKSNCMGNGDDILGEMLMKGFLSTVSELDTLPQEIICYNSGVKLAIKGTPTAENLKKLNSMGIKITLCGTCIDFFGIKKEIAVGEISNMYYIATRLTESNQIVEP
ncbi:MAG TPA: sulfurtransferase-like selenium metabolism protein YedF [Bacteroidetes bacterium]|nr:sulfurtransferase-like selenium metabolism protein YedF [Bacteroidota bacterium]